MHIKLHGLVFFWVLFISCDLNAQLIPGNDTVRIGEVIIKRTKYDSELPGYKTERLDSSVLADYSQLNLADVLENSLNISVKSYGMGGTATASFRGTGAGHTIVDWNGINIGNPMLAQSDLSTISSAMTDGITVYYGGGSVPVGDGGLGGIVNLVTVPDWEDATNISFTTGMGSFGHYSGFLKVKKGSGKFQSSTKIYYQKSENNFRYLDNYSGFEPVWQTRKNNQVNHRAIMQELYLRGKHSVASARIWYQLTDRNLPASMLTAQNSSDERQNDEAFRSLINYHYTKEKSDYHVTGAWIRNRLNYSNKLASVDSRNLSDAFTLKATISQHISESAKAGLIIENNTDVIHTNNYGSAVNRNKASFTALMNYRLAPNLRSVILAREILDGKRFLIPDFSTSLEIRLSAKHDYFFRTSISKNSKLPGLNDLYWLPGGNPDLKNEYSYAYELSYSMFENISPLADMNFELTGYRNYIRDMIQWMPGEYSYWTAGNIGNVNTYGLETSFSLRYRLNKLIARFISGYTYTRAENKIKMSGAMETRGKQLMYIPIHKANAVLRLSYGSLFSSLTSNYTGRSYITYDNSKFLPGYFISNINAGYKYKKKNISIITELGVDNIFNVSYQTIAYYPLPGRFYTFKILLQTVKKTLKTD